MRTKTNLKQNTLQAEELANEKMEEKTMRINHNIAALNTYNKLSANNAATSSSLAKLSSGLKINKAGDDAAGLAISEKMRGQIRGLDQSSANASDGISLVNTAEGALNETHSILQRMRELAVQSSNDTNTDADRAEIQKEVTQLTDEIDRISQTTQFNTKNLLDGSMGKQTVSGNNVMANKALYSGTAGGTQLSGLKDKNGNDLDINKGDKIEVSYVLNGSTVTKSYTVSGTTSATQIATVTNLVSGLASASGISGGAVNAASGLRIASSGGGYAKAVHGLTITVTSSAGVVNAAATQALSSFNEAKAATVARLDGQATFQIGANTNQNMQVSIENMSASALGIAGLDVDTQDKANVAIKVIDEAITKVSSERSKLGSIQNRLDHTINNLGTASENMSSAESRIRDVDMAKEMMQFTKSNILSQAATSMLAQANQQPQNVLSLLK